MSTIVKNQLDGQKKIVRLVAWVIVVLLLLFFLTVEIGLSQQQVFETDFIESDRIFSELGPPRRLAPYSNEERPIIVGEPVYFNVRLPNLTERAAVSVWWRKHPELPDPQIGISLGSDEKFSLYPLITEQAEDGWVHSIALVDVGAVPKMDGAIRFFFSIPGVSADKTFQVSRVEIITHRPTINTLLKLLWTKLRK